MNGSASNRFSVLGNQRGIALVLVLLVVALLTAMILDFDARTRLDVRAAANYRDDAAATALAESAVQAARVLLQELSKPNYPRFDYKNASTEETGFLYWNLIPPYSPREGLDLVLRIEDEAGKFDLNSLFDPEDIKDVAGSGGATGTGGTTGGTGNGGNSAAGTPKILAQERIEMFRRLLTKVLDGVEGLDIDLDRIDGMVDAVVDWRDGNDAALEAESSYYQSLSPPYSARNGAFVSLDELNLVKGFENPAILEALRPYVTVLPIESGQDFNTLHININDAEPPVLAALDEDMSDSELEGIAKALAQKPFMESDLGLTQLPLRVTQFTSFAGNLTRLTKRLTARSQYFTVTAIGTVGNITDDLPDIRRTVTALMYRPVGGAAGVKTNRAKLVWLRVE